MLPPLGPAADMAKFYGLFIWPPVDCALLKELVNVLRLSVLREWFRSASGTDPDAWLFAEAAFYPFAPPG